MATFEVGTGTLRPLPGHSKHQGHGFTDRKPTRADPQAAVSMLFQTALTKASEQKGIALPHRTGRGLCPWQSEGGLLTLEGWLWFLTT